MDRIIEVKVCGSHLTKDTNKAGTKGEANITRLRITFDENWEDFAKHVIFWDAYGQNPVKIVLGTNLIEDIHKSTRVYLVPIPAEAMARAGWLTFSIKGALGNKNQVSITSELEVNDSPDILDPLEPTPSELEQVQAEIETIKTDLQYVATVHKETTKNATIAKESADKAVAAVGQSSYIGDNGNWYAWDIETRAFYDTGVRAQSGSTVYMGANPPEDADVWIENGTTLYFRNEDGVFVPLPVIHGKDGKSAYELAVDNGYKGTIEQFTTLLNNLTASIEGSHLSDTSNPHNVTPQQIGAIPEAYYLSTDLNNELQQGGNKITICCYTSATLNTPKADGVTDYAHGLVITNAYTNQYGTQLCLPSGDYNMYMRRFNKQGITGWMKISPEDIKALQMLTEELSKTAVAKSGDTMTGPLVIERDEAWGQLVLRTPSGYYRAFETNDTVVRIDVRDEQLAAKRRYLDIFTNKGQSDLARALMFCQTVEGNTTGAYVLHTENIDDFVISSGSYVGTGLSIGNTIPIRKTTQAILLVDEKNASYIGMFFRGITRGNNPESSMLTIITWEDESVSFHTGWVKAQNPYRYVLIG